MFSSSVLPSVLSGPLPTPNADYPNVTTNNPVDFNYTLALLGGGAATFLGCTFTVVVFIVAFIRRNHGEPTKKIHRYIDYDDTVEPHNT